MHVDVKVPVLAESIPDATLLDWKKQIGEAVTEGEVLIELETTNSIHSKLRLPVPMVIPTHSFH